jgi:hypothetical protein
MSCSNTDATFFYAGFATFKLILQVPVGPLAEQPRVCYLQSTNPTPPPLPGFALNLTRLFDKPQLFGF